MSQSTFEVDDGLPVRCVVVHLRGQLFIPWDMLWPFFLEQVIVWIVLALHHHPCELSRDFFQGKGLREEANIRNRCNQVQHLT